MGRATGANSTAILSLFPVVARFSRPLGSRAIGTATDFSLKPTSPLTMAEPLTFARLKACERNCLIQPGVLHRPLFKPKEFLHEKAHACLLSIPSSDVSMCSGSVD